MKFAVSVFTFHHWLRQTTNTRLLSNISAKISAKMACKSIGMNLFCYYIFGIGATNGCAIKANSLGLKNLRQK